MGSFSNTQLCCAVRKVFTLLGLSNTTKDIVVLKNMPQLYFRQTKIKPGYSNTVISCLYKNEEPFKFVY